METIDDSILTALGTRSDRLFLFSLEDEFKHLVDTAKSDECIVFPTMTSYHRLLIHKVGERYGLYSESNGWGTERQTTVATTPRSNLPCLSFRDFIIYEGTPPDKNTKKAKLDGLPSTNAATPTVFPTTRTSKAPTTPSTTEPASTIITSSATALTSTSIIDPSTEDSGHPPTNLHTNPPTNASTTNPPITTPPTTTPLTANLSINASTNPSINEPIRPTKTRRPPRTPEDGPRVMRGRGSSKFHTRDDEADNSAASEVEKIVAARQEGDIEGKEGTDGSQHEGGIIMNEEEATPPPKQLPLLNDYSQYEYGNTSSKTRATDTYGFASYEHIVRLISGTTPKAEIEKRLGGFTKQRFTVKCKGDSCYAIFRSVAAAQALLEQSSCFPAEYQLSLLDTTSTPKKEEFTDEVLYPRPETSVRVARRLIGNALEMATLQK